MKIKTQLAISMACFVLLLALVTISLFVTLQQADRTNRQLEIANQLELDAYELSQLSTDFLLNREERQRVQWTAQYAALSADIAGLEPDSPGQQALVNTIRSDQQHLGEIFQDVSSASGSADSRDNTFVTTSWSRMAVQNQGIIAEASRLSQMIRDESERIRQTYTLLIFALAGTILVILLLNYFLIYRRFLASVTSLRKGTEVISSGDLSFRIPESGDDEFRALASSFNFMAATRKSAEDELRHRLAELHATYEQLSATEEELRQNYEELAASQASVRESEARYRLISENSGDVIWLLDPVTERFTYVSPSVGKLRGYTAEEVLGQKMEEVLTSDSYASVRQDLPGRIARFLAGDESERIRTNEIDQVHKNGSVIPTEVVTTILTGPDGEITQILGVTRDITERRRAQAEQMEISRQRQLALDAARLGWWHYDPVTRIASFDSRYTEIFGVTGSTRPNDEILTLLHPDDLPGVWAAVEAALDPANPKAYAIDYRVNATDGVMRWVRAHGIAVFEGSGPGRHAVDFVGTVEDITERKRAEEALRVNKERIEKITRTAPCMLYDYVLFPDDSSRFLFVSERSREIFETEPDVFLRDIHEFWKLIHPDDRAALEDANRAATRKRSLFQYEVRIITPSGRLKWIEIGSLPAPAEPGQPLVWSGFILDITSRKNAEEDLRASEEHYRILHDTITQGVVYQDATGSIISMNSAAVRILGKTREEFLGQTSESVEHDTIREDMSLFPGREHPAMVALRSGAVIRGIVMGIYNPRERDYRWIRIDAVPVFRSGEISPYQVYTIFEDITDRKKAEEALRESEARFRQFFEKNSAVMLIIDPADGSILDANPAAIAFYGYPERKFTSMKVKDINTLPPEEISGILARVREGELHVFQVPHRLADGRVRTVEILATPVRTREAPRLFAIIHDVTDQAADKIALEESEDRFRRAQDAANAGTWEWDLTTNVNYWSEKVFQLYDLDPQVTGPSYDAWLGSIHPEDRAATAGVITNAALRGDPILAEWRVNPAGGNERWLMSRGQPVQDLRGNVIKYRGIVIDITDRKNAEREREALIRNLEEKNTELERFVYTVSHDLKTPLITILGYAGLLEEDAGKEDPVKLKEDIRRIIAAGERMNVLLADTLALSRIGRIVSPPKNVPFARIVQEAAELVAVPLDQRKIRLDIMHDMPVVNVDPDRMREVLVNLLENSIKYMGSQPDPVIRVGMTREGGDDVFFIQDNGIGIDSRYLQRIFNLFEKLDTNTPGSGVGLTIVRRIIEIHGGKIWAESEGPGKGTTIRFTLPAGRILRTGTKPDES